MGHNNHFICVEARNGQDAIRRGEAALAHWGDENNWRRFIRAVSETGEVFENDGEWCPGSPATLEAVNAAMQAESEQDGSKANIDAVLKLAARLRDKGRLPSVKWWQLRQASEDLYYGTGAGKNVWRGRFNVFRHEYRDGVYDQVGVTHLYEADNPGIRRRNKLKKWCVVMDMHS